MPTLLFHKTKNTDHDTSMYNLLLCEHPNLQYFGWLQTTTKYNKYLNLTFFYDKTNRKKPLLNLPAI